MDEKKTQLFETDPIPRAVAALALPSAASTLVMILYNLADTYFVGMLNDPVQTAAVSLAAPALLAFNAINNLFGVGAASLMSRSFGVKDYDTAKKTASFSFWLAALCAALISLVYLCCKPGMLRLLGTDAVTADATERYLLWTVACGALPAILNVVLSNMVRSEGAALHAGIGVMSGCILNIILDPFFVLPQFLGMGAAGAGCATFISNSFSLCYLLGYVLFHRQSTAVCLDPRRFGFEGRIVREVFGVGVPASVQNLLNVTGTLILNNFTAAFGAAAVSAMGIAHKLNMLPLYLSMGVTMGVTPLISYNYASGNRERMKEAILFVLKLALAVTLVMAVLFLLFPEGLMRLFIRTPEVIDIGARLVRAMALGIPFLAVDFLAVSVFQAIGKGTYSLAFAVARKLVLEIPAILLFNRLWPLYGMGYSQPTAELVLAVAAAFMLRKIFRMKPEEEKEEVSE